MPHNYQRCRRVVSQVLGGATEVQRLESAASPRTYHDERCAGKTAEHDARVGFRS